MNRYTFRSDEEGTEYGFYKGRDIALFLHNADGMEFVRADEADERIAELTDDIEFKEAEAQSLTEKVVQLQSTEFTQSLVVARKRIVELEGCVEKCLVRLDKDTEIDKELIVALNRIIELDTERNSLEAECKRMYGVLDDISTAGDQIKPRGCDGYFNAVDKLATQGLNDGLFCSDGYKILRKNSSKDA